MVTTQALDAFVRSLEDEFRSHRRPARIAEVLGEYARANEDWTEFALFSQDHYTRNLVARNRDFELMILCWGAGQESPIHNHEGQDCWMAVLRGEMEEQRYEMPTPGEAGPLRAKSTYRFGKGQVAFIRDEMGLHLVRPAASSRAGGITLHVYAQPYDDCNCYCPETGLVTRKRLGHYSIRGRVLPSPVVT
jgi:cysteine dioxygenase